MQWIEEIRVRTQPKREKEAVRLLREMAKSAAGDAQIVLTRVYAHQSTPGGFTLILIWDTAQVPAEGSEMGMLILEGLKPLGLLDHTVLIERRKGAQ